MNSITKIEKNGTGKKYRIIKNEMSNEKKEEEKEGGKIIKSIVKTEEFDLDENKSKDDNKKKTEDVEELDIDDVLTNKKKEDDKKKKDYKEINKDKPKKEEKIIGWKFKDKTYKTQQGARSAQTRYFNQKLKSLKEEKQTKTIKDKIKKVEEQIKKIKNIREDEKKQIKENKLVFKDMPVINIEKPRPIYKFLKKINELYRDDKKKLILKPDEYSNEEFMRILKVLKNTGEKYMLKFKYQNSYEFFTLNDMTFNRLIEKLKDVNSEVLKGKKEEKIVGVVHSDYILNLVLSKLEKIVITKIKRNKKLKPNKLNEGRFFKYFHKVRNLDLKDLQIYNKDEKIDTENNCFIHSLIKSSLVDKETIEEIKIFCKTRDIPMRKIKEISEKFNLNISIKKDDKRDKLERYGDKNKPEIKLGLLDNHYFIIKEIPITSYALKNYKDIKELDRFNEIYKKEVKKYKREKRFINSYNVVKLLLENKEELLEKINYDDEEILNTPYYNEIEDVKYIEYNENNLSLEYNEYKEKKEDDFINVYFDFETSTDGDKHKAYLCCYYDEKNNKKCFQGENSGRYMLFDLVKKHNYKNLRLVAHNAGYDFRFLYNNLASLKVIDRNKMLLRAYGLFYYEKGKNIKVEIQDSYALIPMPLRDFSKTFNIECKKEFLPYKLYSEDNIKLRYIEEDEIKKYCYKQVKENNIGKNISKDEKEKYFNEFIKNAKEWKCYNEDDEIDILKYSEMYCMMDCKVLKEGYETFKGWIYDITKLNINDYVSLPSLSNEFMKKEGVFKDVYALSGTPQFFINKCMVGGRTMTSENKMIKLDDKDVNIQDFDAVSLYPSAMTRMKGYLKGKPKVVSKENLNYQFLKEKDGYFVEIKVNKVNIKRNLSLMSEINNNGVRVFNNEMENKKIYVDKVSLEDLIEFQKIEFEVIRGYYYDEGRNDKLSFVIKNLFNERLKKKKEGNKIEKVYKLLLNSAYGKTLLKPIECEDKYLNKDKLNNFIERHYNYIKDVIKLNNFTYKVKLIKSIDTHFNNVSCGVEVLSMSKRIMNEVICGAEDINIPIYYQDTDSLHLDGINIKKLEEYYNKKYNRELIGKNMGQFHSDFESNIIKKNIHASRSIFLGKKCYIDELKGLDDDDNEVIDYHIRLKGVSNDAILYECKRRKINPYELYEMLYNYETINFDLGCGGLKCNFKFNKDFTIINNEDFKRKIKFNK